MQGRQQTSDLMSQKSVLAQQGITLQKWQREQEQIMKETAEREEMERNQVGGNL